MSREPRKTARACFALAARATIEGEKQAAINRGMAILENNRLNPDEFDIPGRVRGVNGNRAERVIVDDPFEPDISFDRAAVLGEYLARVMMERGVFDHLFREGRQARAETATQKAEREREERMSAYLRGRNGTR